MDKEDKKKTSAESSTSQPSAIQATYSDLASLKQQRSTMKRNITNMKSKIEKQEDTADATILECRLQILESYFKQICHTQSQIEKISPDDNSRSELEEVYISTKAAIMNLLNTKRRASLADTSVVNPFAFSSPSHHNRLPNLKLPRFDGKYCDYKRFSHTFSNMIDNDPSIPPIDKFNYLLSCLTGQALAVIEPFQITADNYPKALERLKERYDNNVLIFLDYITSLFNIPTTSKADPNTLRNIIDTVSAIRASLLSLGSEADIMNSILIHIVLSKLDAGSKSTYDEKQDYKTLPTWDDCYQILNRRCQLLESRAKSSDAPEPPRGAKSKGHFNKVAHTFISANSKCTYCSGTEHALGSCSTFLSLPVSQRFDFVKRAGLCINCLHKGHSVTKCVSKYRCRVCKSSHHTHLHIFSGTNSSPNPPHIGDAAAINQATLPNAPVSLVVRFFKRAIIPTAVVLIKDNFGSYQPVRALLDSCSEVNFITEETAKRLGLEKKRSNQDISGIGDIRTQIKYAVSATIRSRNANFEWTSEFAITKTISSNQPGEYIAAKNWTIPEGIELADPLFFKPQKVDLLLSTEIFFELLLEGKIMLGKGLPCLIKTVFGWIVGGTFSSNFASRPLTCNVAVEVPNTDSLLRRFWEIEECVPPAQQFSKEEVQCEEHFSKHVAVLPNGRLQVRLPFKEEPQVLGDSLENARRRFFSLERRLNRDQTLHRMYCDFMDEYEALNHMSPVSDTNFRHSHYVIPHHCVLRPESTTTKLRVVFDASARTSSSLSLNDILMVGPTIQQELIITLLSFRLNRYALTADISKIYRQFLVDLPDRNFQLILWRKNIDAPLQLYQLNTVTYGTSAAPFLAIRCLFHIADLHHERYPIGSAVLKRDMYADDLLTGADNEYELEQIKHEVTNILLLSGLQLTKWNSNCARFALSSTKEIPIKSNDEHIAKALGMAWKPMADTICFRFEFSDTQPTTKRSILSTIARIFDVLGLLSPVVIRCKILLQELWIQHVDWDEPVPDTINHLWLQIKDDLPSINQIEIPRFVFTSPSVTSEIHGFADASSRAYGCAIYVRTPLNGSHKTILLIAKSKVAPIKTQSIPRLELCAPLLLTRTWKKIESKLLKYIKEIYFWTDSKIVLQWLKMHASTLNCFVANRVSELQEKTEGIVWRHVPTNSNPADIVSRGCSASELSKTIWFSGPNFLLEDKTKWPILESHSDTTSCLERRNMVSFKCTSAVEKSVIADIIEQHSSYLKILRIVAFLYRAFNKVPADRRIKPGDAVHILSLEKNQTFWRIVADIQRSNYSEEINNLRNGKPLQPELQKLSPFLQSMEIGGATISIFRVGGRLSNAAVPYDVKFPALLPKTHRFTSLYVEYLHRKHLHAGPKILIGLLRQQLWVVNARELVRKTVHACTHCFHYKPKLLGQIMGNLPADRVQAQRPFLVSGVDFCGPFFTTLRIRGKQPYKTYAAIFVCFSSKAVHVELVSDLSTNGFLMCLKRFVGRRGIPLRLYCDNATNFVGANAKLKEFQQKYLSNDALDNIIDFSSEIGFEFCFIPPRAPHFGGLWEAAVKSAKTLLLKNLSQAHLTYEELQTLLIEIEAILNSRPLVPLSNDPNDGAVLTPAHMLIGASLKALPDEQVQLEKNISYLTQWQRITYLKNQFWKEWTRDYLLTLQQRAKWRKPEANIEVGQMVIVHEDNAPPQRWSLARVINAIPGADGKVRVADLQTTKGVMRRAIHKLAPLPRNEVI